MPLEAVALGRNLALILLIIEVVVLAVPLVVIPFYAIRYLRRAKAPIRPKLRQIRAGAERAEKTTKLVSSMTVQPFLWAAGAAEGLKNGLGYLARRR
jgi:hypothetical protein